MLSEIQFDTSQVTLNFAQGPPAGPPFILLHGGGDRWQNFLPIIPQLMLQWQVFALDLRGQDLGLTTWNVSQLLRAVTYFLESI